jgi:O-methyltransferase
MILRIISFLKDFLLFTRVGYLLRPFSRFFKFLSNFSLLTVWVGKQKGLAYSDFYTPVRKYSNRENLYKHISDTEGLSAGKMHYIEFGVATGTAYKWWLRENKNPESSFHGFDTFEGLPEDWGGYKKGDMSSNTPVVHDDRAFFYKGLFQDTLYQFLEAYKSFAPAKKVIHMDADLYSSTLFALTVLAPYLKSGDIIIFDEFNVPNHEFAAWNDFIRSYYLKFETIGSVNNFYQCAFRML